MQARLLLVADLRGRRGREGGNESVPGMRGRDLGDERAVDTRGIGIARDAQRVKDS